MIHPDTELRFIGPEVGHGVVATKLIPKGTITWVRDALDATYTPEEVAALGPLYSATMHKYTYLDARGNHVLCWDAGRFMNHSCNAPCLTAGGLDFEIAIRDILPGEELTADYGTLNTLEPMPCACKTTNCRGSVGPEDTRRLMGLWDERVREVFPLVGSVPQPLMPLVKEREAVHDAIRDPSTLPSCRRHFGPTLGS